MTFFLDYLPLLLIAVYLAIALFLKIINEKFEFLIATVDGMGGRNIFSWLAALSWPIWSAVLLVFAVIIALAFILFFVFLILFVIAQSFIKK